MVQNTCLRVIPPKGQESWAFFIPSLSADVALPHFVTGDASSHLSAGLGRRSLSHDADASSWSLGSTLTGLKNKGRAMTVFVTVHPLQLSQINLHTTLSFKSHHCFLMVVVSHNLLKKKKRRRRYRRGRERSYRPHCCSCC